jgi:transcriptional regulator with XRE-family HTH domain
VVQPDTVQVGQTLRAVRERRGISLKELARETGFSIGYLSRIESGEREPSWAALRTIADVWQLEPILHFVSPARVRAATAEALRDLSPEDRLCRQSYPVFEAVLELVMTVPAAAISGAAAAALQGVPVAVDLLEAVVPDEDECVDQLVLLLRRSFCLYGEPSAEEFRLLDRETWVVRHADATLRLERRMPPVIPMTLGAQPVRVVTLAHLAATDAVVADALDTVADVSA